MTSAQDQWVRGGPRDSGAAPPESLDEALEPFRLELDQMRPRDTALLDCHTHLGHDIDGRSMDLVTLLGILDEAGLQGACVFPLHDPDREPGYRVPNDRVLEWATESGGRLTPFCRLDPAETPREEGERALGQGAKGIKLHPRAQAFNFDSPGVDEIFALSEDARVPLLIHMGRGMPPLAEDLLRVAHRHPGASLILAHAATHDQGVIAAGMADHPACFYDTAVFAAVDIVELYARVPPERIVFGSDPPYGRSFHGLYLALRSARAAGCSEGQIRGLAGETIAALLRGEAPTAPTAPVAPRERLVPGVLQRVTGVIALVMGASFTGAPAIGAEMIEMGIAACRDPEAEGELAATLDRLASVLGVARGLLRDEDTVWYGIGLLQMCMALGMTSSA